MDNPELLDLVWQYWKQETFTKTMKALNRTKNDVDPSLIRLFERHFEKNEPKELSFSLTRFILTTWPSPCRMKSICFKLWIGLRRFWSGIRKVNPFKSVRRINPDDPINPVSPIKPHFSVKILVAPDNEVLAHWKATATLRRRRVERQLSNMQNWWKAATIQRRGCIRPGGHAHFEIALNRLEWAVSHAGKIEKYSKRFCKIVKTQLCKYTLCKTHCVNTIVWGKFVGGNCSSRAAGNATDDPNCVWSGAEVDYSR